MAARITRHWIPPDGCPSTEQIDGSSKSTGRLMLHNSLLDEKVPFVPADGPGSKQITWYTCGPTVYDIAHVGHARNYLTFDIIRRVMEDYFGYNCLFVMNVTDVDDKIILRARRNYLIDQYRAGIKSAQEVQANALQAIEVSLDKQKQKHDEAVALVESAEQESPSGCDSQQPRKKKVEIEAAVKTEAHKLKRIVEAREALNALKATGDQEADVEALMAVASDYIAEALDKRLGSDVTDHSIYRAHAAKYEADFFQDMEALGCRPPDVLTRVSEYMPEIVEYCQRIVANGMGYVSQGSVYFDTRNFRECGHTYGKLKPWAVGSALLAAEGESNFETSEKRSPTDFALWKASKPGEPFWDSPWGRGRPGWHIECSAMASSILGAKMDIHSGGDDLKFPHHDNELAQAEAYYHEKGCKQWVNYFLHAGHLEIEGLKMSKSLKNFISIKESLSKFTPRQLRLMFVLQSWNKSMMYGDAARAEMIAREAQLKNFFQNVAVATRGVQQTSSVARWTEDELDLAQRIQSAQRQVHACLCDNVDTAGAMDAISGLIKSVNLYLGKKEAAGAAAASRAPAQALLLRKAAAFVTKILSVMGIVDMPSDRPGFSELATSAGDGKDAVFLDAFAAFRDEIRALARQKAGPSEFTEACYRSRDAFSAASAAGKANEYLGAFLGFINQVGSLASSNANPKAVLAACDEVRDGALVDLGVRLEDKADGKAVWKLDDPAVMRAEQQERARQAAEQASKKVVAQLQLKQKDKDKFEKLLAMPSPQESLSDKYSKFDPTSGEPTHDKDGVELEGKARDKARKDLEKARKVVEPLTKKLAEDPDFMSKLDADIKQLSLQIEQLGL